MTRTFVSDPKFGEVHRALCSRGWAALPLGAANPSLSWRNLRHTRFGSLRPDTYVNHLENAQVLSHKATLAVLLEFEPRFPRCYDLRLPAHASSFLTHSAASAAAAALRRIVARPEAVSAAARGGGSDTMLGDACIACVRAFPVRSRAGDAVLAALLGARQRRGPARASDAAWLAAIVRVEVSAARAALAVFETAAPGEAAHGAWLVKPAGGSCGEGIAVVASLADAVRAARATRFRVVAQKYVERGARA